MLRSAFIAVVGLVVLSQTILQADDVKKPKATKKPAFKQVEKKEQSVLLRKAAKTKQPEKAKPAAATIGNETEYYTTSPAQGRPADGTLPAGTKVKVIKKAGSYVRVKAVIEAYVPADSVQAAKKPVLKKKAAPVDKAAVIKKKAAADKGGAVQKKKAPVAKPILDKKQPAKDGAALKKKAAVDNAALKKKALAEQKAAAEKKAGANQKTDKKNAQKKKVDKK